eukprot:TRINITY_DN1843_c0_g1_i2.p1 TRINITY_DN1843_c0_g1~~TRINITY_DN1843_c0_g1_i2.p1  ORF type:complete len:242 (-),score=69.00 TRINITY_DN1843_c0_g1_i2:115-810(-)
MSHITGLRIARIAAPAGLQFRSTASSTCKWPQPKPNVGRFKGPTADKMTPTQRRIAEEITRNRTTGMRGPFGPWLANPDICQPAQQLGHVLRYDIYSLSAAEREAVILTVARACNSPAEWAIHVPEARRAGLTDLVIEEIRQEVEDLPKGIAFIVPSSEGLTNSSCPTGFEDRVSLAYRFARSLATTHMVSDELYDEAVEMIGQVGTVEMTVLVGYYSMVAMTVNVFNVSA